MNVKFAVSAVGIALLLLVSPVHAHHPFDDEYDAGKSVTVKGTVTKFEWVSPHVMLSMDVKDTNGQTTNWTFEMGSPKKLKDFAWTKDTLKPGDEITVNAWGAKDGSKRGSANMITMSDGTKYVGGSSFFDSGRPISN